MPTLSFELAAVMPIYRHALTTERHSPTYDQQFDAAFHKGGIVRLDKDGWPDYDNIDLERVPSQLFLVGDHGVYMMSAGEPGLMRKDGEGHVVVYADGCDPRTDENWYEQKRRLLGGDDCVISVPVKWISKLLELKPRARTVKIRVTSNDVALVL